MKYIKINTPLQIKGGFTINSGLVDMKINYHPAYGKRVVFIDVYKDYDAYNKREERLKLKADLPDLQNVIDDYEKKGRLIAYYDLLDLYLPILKANEYDCEIVDTDAQVSFKEQLKQAKTDAQELRQCENFDAIEEAKNLTKLLNNIDANLINTKYHISSTNMDFEKAEIIVDNYKRIYDNLKAISFMYGLEIKF